MNRDYAYLLTFEKYGPGKFSNSLEEYAFLSALEGANEECGDAETCGWFGMVLLEPEEKRLLEVNNGYESVVGFVIQTDDHGRVKVDWYSSEAVLRERWARVQAECASWDSEE